MGTGITEPLDLLLTTIGLSLMTATIANPVQDPSEGIITTTDSIAVLPAAILWAVAKAASTDDTKPELCCIDVRREKGNLVRIAASDGFRVFRCYVRQNGPWFVSAKQTAPLRLDPKAFKKFPSRNAPVARIESDGRVYFGPVTGRAVSMQHWEPNDRIRNRDFPQIDHLWSKGSQHKSDAPIALDGEYMASVGEVASKLSPKRIVKVWPSAPSVPVGFRAVVDPSFLLQEGEAAREETCLDFLVMPIQIRA